MDVREEEIGRRKHKQEKEGRETDGWIEKRQERKYGVEEEGTGGRREKRGEGRANKEGEGT